MMGYHSSECVHTTTRGRTGPPSHHHQQPAATCFP